MICMYFSPALLCEYLLVVQDRRDLSLCPTGLLAAGLG